ncbi:MAG TPA: Omp28-related outer membrane protein [Flavobacteriaceae bacterium]|nr:Omp28-related outer membrane protein [Flavobacteriaceae bacterium]
MRKILLSIALLCSAGLFAQNLVSTTPQNKKVVLEEFTGINCVFCPDGHRIAQAIKDQNPDDVFLINVHVGGFANPGSGQPDFRTSFGTALANQSGLQGYPSGTVNRHVFSGSTTALGRGSWAAAANIILQQESYVNIAGTAEIDVLTNELNVTVEVYYTGDSPEATNKLNVALLQDNTLGPQTGGNMGNNYVHMHRLVHFLTGQWGEDVTNTTEGSFEEFTFTYEIPNDYRDVDVVLEDLKVIAYLAEGNQEILTGDEMQINFINVAENDVSLNKIMDITPTCLDRISPSIEIENRGSNLLTSLDITYSVNNSDPQIFTWTGSLDLFEKEVVQLDEIYFTLSEDDNVLEVTLPDDDNNDNNIKNQTITPSIEGSTYSTLEIRTYATGPTTTWEIKDISGDVLYSGGEYDNYSSHDIELELPDGCYEIIIEETGPYSSARFNLIDDGGKLLFQSGSSYGNGISGDFRTNSLLNVDDFSQESITLYPNPTDGIVHIENAEGFQVEVFNILGKVVLNKAHITNQETLNLSNLTAGVYYVKLQNENTTEVKKVVVK